MESAEQLENGNFESVWNKKEINGGNGSWSRPLYCYYLPGWNTRNERTTKGGEVPQAGEQESVMESGGAGVPVLFQQQTAAKTQML